MALTAHAMAEDRDACLAAGMDDYLSKPIQPDKLAAVLERWARKGQGDESDVSVGEGEGIASPVRPGPVPVFDPHVLLRLLDGDREAVDEVMTEYAKDAPRQVTALREALAAGDADATRRHAHTLKGASANVGAEALRAAAYEVEKAGAAGDLDAASGLVGRVEAELKRLQDHLAGGDARP